MIKIWHVIIIFIMTPFFFIWVTPDGINAYSITGAILSVFICAFCFVAVVEPDVIKTLNKELEK